MFIVVILECLRLCFQMFCLKLISSNLVLIRLQVCNWASSYPLFNEVQFSLKSVPLFAVEL